MRRDVLYQSAGPALVRAARYARLPLPPLPEVSDGSPAEVQRWHEWLRAVWAHKEVAELVEQSSPGFARHLDTLCAESARDARQVRRTLVSLMRYVQRITGRATPNGVAAGVAPATFGTRTQVRWGAWHRAVAVVDDVWVTGLVRRLEDDPALLLGLPVVANMAAFVRGRRLVVPYPPSNLPGCRPPAEVSLRYTSAVRAAVEEAQSPIVFEVLAQKMRAEFDQVPVERFQGLLANLVRSGVLVTALHAPSTTLDPLGHLLQTVASAEAQELGGVAAQFEEARAMWRGVRQHNQALAASDGRRLRGALHHRMVRRGAERPLAVNLRLDSSVVLPQQVLREAESAATVLARLSPAPFGTPGWKAYHVRFFEKYGIGSLVPLRDVVDPDVGLGFPPGYLDSEVEPREPLTKREQLLLALAQTAVLTGGQEVVLDDRQVAEIGGDRDEMRVPPHMEVVFEIGADSEVALDQGDFVLSAVHPTRGIGTTSGRFLDLLEGGDRARAATVLGNLPTNTPGALPVQLSFPPLNRNHATVARVPQVLSCVVSVAEYRPDGAESISLDDLAVGCDRSRLYVVSLSRRRVVEPHVLHALDLRAHTPPLVRFLAEISRAQSAVVTDFAWGAAAALPYLPRVRYGRAVLSRARWLLHTQDVPGPSASWAQWHTAVEEWRGLRRVPSAVSLTEGDQCLPLDLSQSAHRAILRAHLASSPTAVLTESAVRGSGWFGGRAHEVVVPLSATRVPAWPVVPPVAEERMLSRDHGHLPGSSPWLLVQLYGHPERQAEILGHHLPDLLARWESAPAWWFLRYQDPRPHLRLRLAVPQDTDVGVAVTRVSEWVARLRGAGLVSDLKFATTYPETGRWGRGPLMAAAEEVFAADSRVLAVQFTHPHGRTPRALTAANFCAIAAAFTGSLAEGMEWLIKYGKVAGPRALNRAEVDEVARLASPGTGRAVLEALPGGAALVHAWDERARVLAAYRALVDGDDSLRSEAVLGSLLHAHHIRAAGINKDDERTCMRLARAAARASEARQR
ncbi:lantibiotic dehydratase [Streptomyces sp. NBC_00237]|uniref:lantibiotic dehydratase n=1 Tax=Streptomyces sp. NBC_00237 TaxID=2975687 RepID=UPI00224F6F6D|nr:lantibiotic dehydratase [Streptomyces sp. NBC_00237]MCX5206722.1 lantibiotic dehydratase [Streptomyces sp. NBC_00237]